MLMLISLLAADPVAMMKIADERMAVATTPATPEAPRRSPYRLDPNVAGPADGKAAAVSTTGSRCAITGPTLCTKKARTVFSSAY